MTPRKQKVELDQRQSEPLAQIVESADTLAVVQSDGPALRNLRNTFVIIFSNIAFILVLYLIFPQAVTFWISAWLPSSAVPAPMLILLLCTFPWIWMLIQSINRFFGRETFVFDKNKGSFIRNGFTVCSLREIQAVTAQVTNNGGQYPIFRLILELPQCQIVTLVKTHDVAGIGEFHLSRSAYSGPICQDSQVSFLRRIVPFFFLVLFHRS